MWTKRRYHWQEIEQDSLLGYTLFNRHRLEEVDLEGYNNTIMRAKDRFIENNKRLPKPWELEQAILVQIAKDEEDNIRVYRRGGTITGVFDWFKNLGG